MKIGTHVWFGGRVASVICIAKAFIEISEIYGVIILVIPTKSFNKCLNYPINHPHHMKILWTP